MPYRPGVAAGLFAVAFFAQAGFAQEGPAIFAPSNESIVPAGPLRIIARADGKPKLLLDGKPVAAVSPAPGVLMAEVKATEGLHQLTLESGQGKTTITFFAGKQHSSWRMFRLHPPPAAACETCHVVKNDIWTWKRATLSPICHACHDGEKFVAWHTHNIDTLADCQNCHLPHGSTAKGHLKQPKEVACKQCHN